MSKSLKDQAKAKLQAGVKSGAEGGRSMSKSLKGQARAKLQARAQARASAGAKAAPPRGAAKKPSPSSGKSSSARGAINVTIERSMFFESGIKTMKRLSYFLVVLAAISVGVSVFSVNKKSAPAYFLADSNGQLTRMIPLSQPNHSQQAVAQWLSDALIYTFDFHFGNVESRLNDAAVKWFTTEGADALISTWDDSGNYRAVVDRKLFVSLALRHTPLLIRHGLPGDGRAYLWRYQVPAILTFRNQTGEFTNPVTFTVDVSRRSLLEGAEGLGISKIIMRIES